MSDFKVGSELKEFLDTLGFLNKTGKLRGAASCTPDDGDYSAFGTFGEPATIQRAAYFRRVSDCLSINPYEPIAMTLEPPHPYRVDEVAEVFSRLGFADELSTMFTDAGFTILAPRLFTTYLKGCSFDQLVEPHCLTNRDYLLDPLYGTVMWRDGEFVAQHVLVKELFTRAIDDLPPEKREDAWLHPSVVLLEGTQRLHDLTKGHVAGFFGPNMPVRCEWIEPFTISVKTLGHFRAVVDRLSAFVGIRPDIQLWYRGQVCDYLIPDRSALADLGVATYCAVRDSSLVPSLYRDIDRWTDSLEGYEKHVLHFLDWSRRADRLLGPAYTARLPSQIGDDPFQFGDDAFPTVPGPKWTTTWVTRDAEGRVLGREVRDHHVQARIIQQGLFQQHYGFPSGWLDITRDPNIGLWFALRKYEQDGGRGSYEEFTWSGDDAELWPTVYVFLLRPAIDPMIDTETLLQGTGALRAQRQHCGLLGGAGNIARNYPARYLALKIRIAPGFTWQEAPPPEYFIPGPDEDMMLRSLLDIEQESDFEVLFPVTRLHN